MPWRRMQRAERWTYFLLAAAIGLVGMMPAGQGAEQPGAHMLADAQLTDVFFLSADSGWAIGDRGVIWRTEDGGRHWQQRQAPVPCRLESIFFVDEQHGWIVGGSLRPYTGQTRGLVLGTHDGGRHWEVIENPTLPWLKQVQFLDPSHGWAVGMPSMLYPAGIFRSDDGGRSWTPVPAGRQGAWLAAAFQDRQRGVAVGHDGRLAVVASPQVQSARTADVIVDRRCLRAVKLADAQRGWAVGDGGLVLQTADGGASWRRPHGLPAPPASGLFDFHDVAVVGQHVWVAGAPGTRLLHSADGGASWQWLDTRQALPIRALTFADPQRGWAVGDLGTILATSDGGRTWRPQRAGGRRLALLGFFSEPQRIPLELIALHAGDEGYRAFAELVGRRDVELPEPTRPRPQDVGHSALVAVGATGADQWWPFPLRQSPVCESTDAVLAGWNRVHEGRALERLTERLVRKIRQWRPEVVVTEPPGPPGQRAVSDVLHRMVLAAVRQAADPAVLPEHRELAGLAPWTVHKVVAEAEQAELATLTVTTSQLATRLGRSIADHAARGHALLRPDYRSVPLKLGFDLVWTNLPQATGQQSLFSGIHLQAGGEARRVLGPPQGDLRSLTRAAQKQRNLQQLLNRTATAPLNSAGWLGQLEDLTRGLSREAAGQLLYQLAEHYHQAGQWELAAQALEQLIERAPDHALSDSALVRLLQQHSSAEIAWQLRGQTQVHSQVVRAIPFGPARRDGVRTAQHTEPVDPPAGRSAKVTREAVSATANLERALAERAGRGLVFGRTIQRTRPALFADPHVRFPMSVAYRAKGQSQDAQRFYHRLAALPNGSPWEACAKAELWFIHGRGACPKPRYRCRATASRPRLDGQLEDETWADAAVMELKSPHHDDQQWPAVVMLAWDEQFLFLAATCRKLPGRDYAAPSRPRPRDGDLRSRDRIELLLDTDRDYTTYYQLRVDERGWTGEACAGCSQWNPTWYVAADQTDRDWTVEAAIPFSELGPVPGRGGQHIWALGVQRILPGVGIQSYTPPAAVAPRTEGFALLTFQ